MKLPIKAIIHNALSFQSYAEKQRVKRSWNKLALLYSAALFMPRKPLDMAEAGGRPWGWGELITALLSIPP